MQRYTVYYIWKHVSGGTTTHHQKRKQLYLQHLAFVTPLLLLAAIVEGLELVWVCCGWRTRQVAGSSNGVTNTRCCRYSCLRCWWWVVVPPETCRAVSRYNKLCNVASCWIYIRMFLRYTDPWMLNLFNILVQCSSIFTYIFMYQIQDKSGIRTFGFHEGWKNLE